MNYKEFFLILLIIAIESSSVSLLEAFILKKVSIHYLYLAILLFFSLGYFYFLLLKLEKSLAIANVLANGGSILAVSVIGYYFFNQKLTNKQLLGILFIMLGIFLVS